MSAIVPTYMRRDNLRAVVEPLLADPATTEVIVVVDGARDGSIELLTAWATTEPRLRPLFIDNRGPAGAQQAGVEHATGDVVLLLADDVIAGPGMVAGHARHHEAERGLVVVGYMPIAAPDGSRRPGDFATELYAVEYERVCERYERDPGAVLANLWGGNVSLRRADCLRVPVYTPSFPEHYHEDQDFGIRCAKAGLRGRFDRGLLARHAHTRTPEQFLRDARKEGAGKVAIHREHADLLGPFDASTLEAGLPAPARWAVRLGRRPRARDLEIAALRRTTSAAGRMRLYPVELRAAQLARRIEIQAGALGAASRGDGRSLAPPRLSD